MSQRNISSSDPVPTTCTNRMCACTKQHKDPLLVAARHHVFDERKHRTHVFFSGSALRKMPFESRTKCWTLVWFAAALSAAAAPCVCPEECTCDLREGSIDCSNRGLRTIPVTLNCAWPNVTKMQVHKIVYTTNRLR